MKKLALPIIVSLALALGGCGPLQAQDNDVTSAQGNGTENASATVADAKTPSAGKTSAKKAGSTKKIKRVDVSFRFSHMPTEASNQVALWVENAKGKVVRTLYVSDFTAARRGFERREQALPHWVSRAKAHSMSQKALDAVSGATPSDGKRTFHWDLRDAKGRKVKRGTYTLKLEGTLYWGSNVLYTAEVRLPKGKAGKLTVRKKRSEPTTSKNAEMISKVTVTAR